MSDFLKPNPKIINKLVKSNIAKRFKEGRGQGIGAAYKPFLEVRDVPSKGRSHRLPSVVHGRVVHLLSDLELATFYLFDWSTLMVDIREQFPLNIDDTVALAEKLGIRHPQYKGILQVMTTDFLIDMRDGTENKRFAISVKYSSDLEDKRVIEKQELERQYWESKGIIWFIMTEKEIPAILVKNIRWLLPHMYSYELTNEDQIQIFQQIHYAFETYPVNKVSYLMAQLDKAHGEEPGTYLKYLRHLLAQRAFLWEMGQIQHTILKSDEITPSELWINGEANYVFA